MPAAPASGGKQSRPARPGLQTVPSRSGAPPDPEGLAENRSRCEPRRNMARARSDSPLLFEILERPDFSFETKAMAEGLWPVAGMDEAGRGPLAGPVVAAAVVLDPANIPDRLDDSKRLSPLPPQS